MPEADLDSLQKKWDEQGEKGYELYKQLLPKLENLKGQHVVINVETGDYVVGKTEVEAHRAFKEKFGKATGWLTQIGATYVPV